MSSAQQWADADAAAVQLNDYFSDLAARRRAESRDDLMSALVAISDASDGRLSDSELLDNLTLLLVAGFETTANLLGNGLQIVLHDPSVGDAVRDGSVSAAAFVEEVLRGYETLQVRTTKSGD